MYPIAFISSTPFSEQMFDGCKGMIEYHPWARPAHNHLDFFVHLWSITMGRAFLAGGFILPITASVKAAMGIV